MAYSSDLTITQFGVFNKAAPPTNRSANSSTSSIPVLVCLDHDLRSGAIRWSEAADFSQGCAPSPSKGRFLAPCHSHFALNSAPPPTLHAQPPSDPATRAAPPSAKPSGRARLHVRPQRLAGPLMPKASHGRAAGFLGPMPCARRQRSERSLVRSRRSSGVNRGRIEPAGRVRPLSR